MVVGRGEGYERRVLFHMGVPNIEAALETAVSGERQEADGTPGTLVVGQFTDPEANLVGAPEPQPTGTPSMLCIG